MSWPNDKVLSFINAVHLRSELWDVEDVNFRDRSVKRDSWEAVGKEFDISGEEAQKKFKNLRTYAQTERKKCGKSGSAASRRKPWFAFEAIKFVLARDIPNPGVSSESVGSASDMNQEETDIEYELNQTPENPRGPNPLVRKKKTNSLDEETINAAKMVLVDATIRTPATAFGEYVAQKLAGYDPRIRSEVEMKIMQVLHEADMQTFQRSSQVLPSTSFQWESSASYEGVESDTTDSLSLRSDVVSEALRIANEE